MQNLLTGPTLIFLTLKQASATYCLVYTLCPVSVQCTLLFSKLVCIHKYICNTQMCVLNLQLCFSETLPAVHFLCPLHIAKCGPLTRQHFLHRPFFSVLGPIRVTFSSPHFCLTRNPIRKLKFLCRAAVVSSDPIY